MPMEPVREGELHPLQNCYILEMILKGLSLDDLKSCRQVCKEWCRESSAIMRRRVRMVTLNSASGLDRISDFMEIMKGKRENNGFANLPFKVNLDCTLEKVPREVWEFCGSSISSMYLILEGSSGDAFRHAVFQSCVNLEELGIQVENGGNVEEPNEWVAPRFPPNPNLKGVCFSGGMVEGISWMEFFGHFPALENVVAVEEMVESLSGFFPSLALARRHDSQCWKLKHLEFRLGRIITPVAIAPAFEDMNLPIMMLGVKEIRRSEDVIAVKRILASQVQSLKDLCLIGDCQNQMQIDDLQVMQVFPVRNNAVFEKVTKLQLFYVHLVSVSFLQSFPNLKTLILGDTVKGLPQFAQEPVSNWVHRSCTILSLEMEHLSPEAVRRLLSRLPNLEKLEAFFCDNDQFGVICEHLLKLKQLDLRECTVNDTGISGLTEEDVARINENGEEAGWWPSTWMARPNLSRLKNLKRLCMYPRFHQRTVLDYTSAIYIRQLPQLQHLSVDGFALRPRDIWDRLLTRLRP